MRSRSLRAGLTLVELVVALTLMGAAVSLGYASLSTLSDRAEALELAATATRDAAGARGELIAWLSGATIDPVRPGPSFIANDRLHEGVADDELTFLTLAETPLGAARTTVRLRIARDSAGLAHGFVAEFEDRATGRRSQRLLAPDAIGLDVRYRSAVAVGPGWNKEWVTGTLLPLGAELTIIMRADAASDPLLRLPIRVAFEELR